MKKSVFLLLLFLSCAHTASAELKEQPVFGPKQYDVFERCGLENRYQETFSAAEGVYFIKIQNGEFKTGRSESVELVVNDRKLITAGNYGYPFIAGVATLRKENSLEVAIKDMPVDPTTCTKLPPRFVVLSVAPQSSVKLPEGAFGVSSWERLQDLAEALWKIKAPESFLLAVSALDLGNSATTRAEAIRKLSDRKDANARDYLAFLLKDFFLNTDVQSEAALSLGVLRDKESIPVLLLGLNSEEQKVTIGSARALSRYQEDELREPFAAMFTELDSRRMPSLTTALLESGWKPVGLIKPLAESPDHYVANSAIALLGAMRDPGATELLLSLLTDPGDRDPVRIIKALGESRDPRAIEPLSKMAEDPTARTGAEVALGNALASLGDQNTAPLIADMIRNVSDPNMRRALRSAYKKLTGKAYKTPPKGSLSSSRGEQPQE